MSNREQNSKEQTMTIEMILAKFKFTSIMYNCHDFVLTGYDAKNGMWLALCEGNGQTYKLPQSAIDAAL
jgi:hypothetical protein